jgi:hypothetical protein
MAAKELGPHPLYAAFSFTQRLRSGLLHVVVCTKIVLVQARWSIGLKICSAQSCPVGSEPSDDMLSRSGRGTSTNALDVGPMGGYVKSLGKPWVWHDIGVTKSRITTCNCRDSGMTRISDCIQKRCFLLRTNTFTPMAHIGACLSSPQPPWINPSGAVLR